MSHIVQIQTQVRDPIAVSVACQRSRLAAPQMEAVKLFTTTETELVVRLNGWRYPVVCDLTSGSVKYDNYIGNLGKRALGMRVQEQLTAKFHQTIPQQQALR